MFTYSARCGSIIFFVNIKMMIKVTNTFFVQYSLLWFLITHYQFLKVRIISANLPLHFCFSFFERDFRIFDGHKDNLPNNGRKYFDSMINKFFFLIYFFVYSWYCLLLASLRLYYPFVLFLWIILHFIIEFRVISDLLFVFLSFDIF